MATEKTTQILEEIKALTILEMKDLVAALEEEFGVSAAPVAVAGAAAPAAAAAEAEKTVRLPGISGYRSSGRFGTGQAFLVLCTGRHRLPFQYRRR